MTTVSPSDRVNALLTSATGTWTLDPFATTIELRTKSMWGLAKVKGKFKAREGEGKVTADGILTGTLTVDASSLTTGIKKRDEHLRSAAFLDSHKYPTLTYTAQGANPVGDDKVKVSGSLTVRGQTRPLDIVVTVVRAGADSVVLQSEFEVDRSHWGISLANMGASLANQISVKARFDRH
jgi:polyisoprenoid-binding protein YceI